jgi:hypothetical protein
MLSLNSLHYNVLIAQMLRTPAIMAAALKHLKGEFFTLPEVAGTKIQALIFTVIADHVKDHNTAPDMAMLHVYIESALGGLLQDEDLKKEYLDGLAAFEAFAPKVDDRSIKLCQEMIQQLADTCVFEPAAMELISSGAMSTPVDQLDDLICKLQEVSSQRRSTSASDVVNNVMTTKIEDGERELSGVSWFDARCGEGRGPVMGTVMGLLSPQGGGKCLGKGTRVRLFNGQVVNVEDVVVGDLLMGPDSSPRRVLRTNTGSGPLYQITPEWFDSFVCNDVHILTLQNIDTKVIVDIPLNEYLLKCKWYKERHKLFRASVEYSEKPTDLDPYMVGLWLGDGTRVDGQPSITKNDSEVLDWCRDYAEQLGMRTRDHIDKRSKAKSIHMTKWVKGAAAASPMRVQFRKCLNARNEKFIPDNYLYNSRANRLSLFAGLIDTDGHAKSNSSGCVEYVSKDVPLADGVRTLALSLGFNVASCVKYVNGQPYQRLHISGNFTEVPCRIPRKRAGVSTYKRHRGNRSKFTVDAIGVGQYYGFTLDGDGRFLLEDFTVTHNTTSGFEFCISKALMGKPALLALAEEGLTRNVLNKIAARTTGISATEIGKIDVTDFSNILALGKNLGMDLDMLKLKHDMVQKHLHVLDLVENEGGMEEIESTIDSMSMSDKKPHTIYIDWAGIMAERVMQVGLRGREFTDTFDALKALSFAAENLAERHNTFTVFSHQLGSVAAAKGVGYNTTVYDAADCKTWTAPFMYVLTISAMHPKTLLQRARLVKARYEPAGQEAVLKLHGALARFEDMSDKFELRGKNFVSKTPKDSKAMPKEK